MGWAVDMKKAREKRAEAIKEVKQNVLNEYLKSAETIKTPTANLLTPYYNDSESNNAEGKDIATNPNTTQEGAVERWNKYYDEQAERLVSSYAGAQQLLDDEKKRSQQTASITYDKLKKYLPEQLKAQGLGGLGISETAMLQAQNNYANQMADISAEYGANTSSLETEKANALGELENYRTEKIDEIQTEQYNAVYNEVSVNIKARFNSMIGDDGKISQADFEALQQDVNNAAEKVGADNAALLQEQLNGYKLQIRSEEEQETFEKQTAWSTPSVENRITIMQDKGNWDSGNGDDIQVSMGGTTYYVEKGYNASSSLNQKLIEEYKTSTGRTPGHGACMIYEGRVYMYLPDESESDDFESWCVIQARNTSSRDNQFAQLCNRLGIEQYQRDYKDE